MAALVPNMLRKITKLLITQQPLKLDKKNKQIFWILRILEKKFDVCLINLKTIKFYFIKLAKISYDNQAI